MKVAIHVINGVFDSGLATSADAFALANGLASEAGAGGLRFDVAFVGTRREIRTANGLLIPLAARGHARPDVALVPALGAIRPDTLVPALANPEISDTLEHLYAYPKKTLVGAACTGTFVLAEGGLLRGQRATTTWWLGSLFRQRYPDVDLDESEMIVASANRITAGAALAHLDLALWVIRQASPILAALTARYLVRDNRPSQAAYAIPDQIAHEDALVKRFEKWVRINYATPFSLAAAAYDAGVSERTLARKTQFVLGRSPLAYVQDIRVHAAAQMLMNTDLSIDVVAARVGYANPATLRTLLRRRLGRGVKELRKAL